VHPSVFERRQVASPQQYENQQLDLRSPGKACLVQSDVFRDRRKEVKATVCEKELKVHVFVQHPDDIHDPEKQKTVGCVEVLAQ
jgi:hypothetical protein